MYTWMYVYILRCMAIVERYVGIHLKGRHIETSYCTELVLSSEVKGSGVIWEGGWQGPALKSPSTLLSPYPYFECSAHATPSLNFITPWGW